MKNMDSNRSLTNRPVPFGLDPERDRPRGYTEYVSGEDSWREAGIRIKWTHPRTPGPIRSRAHLDSPIKLRLCLETKVEMDVPPGNLTAWCWTPVITEANPYGLWKEIELRYNPVCTQWDDCGIRTYVFVGNVKAITDDVYRITFNVKWNQVMVWANHFRDDNIADVDMNPSVGTQTVRYPKVHFTSNFAEGQTDKCVESTEIARPARLTRRGYEEREEDLEMMVMF